MIIRLGVQNQYEIQDFDTGFTPSSNEWYHVVLTRDAANGLLNVYVTGEDGVTNIYSPTSFANNSLSNGSMSIGVDDGFYTWAFYGQVSGVRLYNGILSASDVQELYQDGSMDNTSLNIPTFSAGYNGSTEAIVQDNANLISASQKNPL